MAQNPEKEQGEGRSSLAWETEASQGEGRRNIQRVKAWEMGSEEKKGTAREAGK